MAELRSMGFIEWSNYSIRDNILYDCEGFSETGAVGVEVIGGWPSRLWWRFWLGRIQGWFDR